MLSNLEKIKEISENLVWPTLIENDPKTFIPEVLFISSVQNERL